jgi:hypothetical protein
VIDCMTCRVRVSRGCPTHGEIRAADGITCAATRGTTHVEHVMEDVDRPAHVFSYNRVAGCWMSFEDAGLWWIRRVAT